MSPGSVAVLCTGNSCRSQMAAAYFELYGAPGLVVTSAGTEPAEHVHPLAVAAMAQEGVDLSERRPRHIDELLAGSTPDGVITVCDAADRSCPSWPGVRERLHWPFEDPAAFEGDDALERCCQVRDQIRERVVAWLEARGWAAERA